MAAVLGRFPAKGVARAIFLRKTVKVTSKSRRITFQEKTRDMSTVSSKQEVNGVKIYHEIAGQGSVVLCLPGALGSTQSDFGPQLKGLSDEFTVVAFDPRGYGKSIPPKRDFPADFFARDADDTAGLMEALGEWRLYTTICVQPWSMTVFSHVFTFQTRQFPRQLCPADQWKCFLWRMKLCVFVKTNVARFVHVVCRFDKIKDMFSSLCRTLRAIERYTYYKKSPNC